MRPKAPFLAVFLFAILACVAGAALAADGQAPAAPAASPAVQQPALQPALAPLFLTDTYLCSYDVTDPCTGGIFTTCYIQCNVGQSCRCSVAYGQGVDCAYVSHVYPPFCY